MHPRTDPVGKVSEMYKEGESQVPYLTFMHIFNDLLEDPLRVVPRKPSEELKEKFRAACMAVGMGIVDPEGRAEQRVNEFKTRVVPVWLETMDERESRDTDALLRGVRRRPRSDPKQSDDTHFDLNKPVSEKSSALLARLRLIDVGNAQESSDTVTATGTPAPGEALAPAAAADGVYGSMSEICRAISRGLIKVAPGDDQGRMLGKYSISGHTVSVKLARASGQVYAVLTTDMGVDTVNGGTAAMDEMAASMGFLKMTGNAYMRKQEQHVHTLKAMPKKVSLACAVSENDLGEAIVSLLSRLHWDMGELIERMEQA